jgi:hypothetical protein
MVKRLPRAPDLLSRRQLLLAAVTAALLPGRMIAAAGPQSASLQDQADAGTIDWSDFQHRMNALADAQAASGIDQQALITSGLQNLKQLDISSPQFLAAVDASYETGNRYWLWQRMIKQQNINGGILNINREQLVQLHDHPGATGLLRIISGEVEVWQFDESAEHDAASPGLRELTRVSRNVLRAGDMAVLTPDKGNIHALRSISAECRMLDFFIPPYEASQRNWYQPQLADWFDKERILCRKIPQHAYMNA